MLANPTFLPAPVRPAELAKLNAEQAITSLLAKAVEWRASDLFLLSDERFVTVAVRRLGAVERLAVIASELGRQMMSHIKAFADMDITEKRRPADGRWIQEVNGHKLDMRLNFTPTLHGEDLTIRICDRALTPGCLEELGLPPSERKRLLAMLNQTSGLIVVSGPTGAGKTTTIYACLRYLNDGARKINTLEDPIEYALEGVRQSQVNPKLGLDFAELLRHVLRQAPNVIMIGEIRDPETMTTAVRAANSGQLVLATLHGPNAAGSIQTMRTLGANPYFLSSCLLGIVSQRLVRTLCPTCRQANPTRTLPDAFQELASLLKDETTELYEPIGCEQCRHLGYTGRTGLFEIMHVNPELRQLIAQSASSQELHQAAIAAGMVDLRQAALRKVAEGLTSLDEFLHGLLADPADVEVE